MEIIFLYFIWTNKTLRQVNCNKLQSGMGKIYFPETRNLLINQNTLSGLYIDNKSILLCSHTQESFWYLLDWIWGFPGGPSDKEPTCQCRRHKRCGFNPWVGKILWRRQPTLVFLPEGSHGQRSLVGHSPYSHKKLDWTRATQHRLNWIRENFFGNASWRWEWK